MSDQSIFGNQPNSQETPAQEQGVSNNTQPSQNSDPIANLLGSIKNEQGQQKYSNPTEALKALAHSQEYIPQLKQENNTLKAELEQLRAQVEKLKGVESVVEKLTSQQQQSVPTNTPALDENAIAELVTRTLSKRDAEAIQQANITNVASKLQTAYGAEAEKIFYGKAQELGMTVQQMNQLAASSPQAVFQIFGLQAQKEVPQSKAPSAVAPGVNTAGFQPKQDTFIGRNQKSVTVGATTREVLAELDASRKMVEELQQNGMSINDLANPKNYFKLFGKKE